MRINYCNKEELRFEVLKGISAQDAMEHGCELGSAKETLGNAEVNQRKIFVGIDQGIGKNEENVLVVMHICMISQGKEWTRKIMKQNVY